MTQLVYQPAFDPYNTAFRLLRLRDGIRLDEPMPFEGIRILDFFLLFPFLIRDVRLKQKDKNFRKLSEGYENLRPYARMPESSQLLERMRPFQLAAGKRLAASEFINPKIWKEGAFLKSETVLPLDLKSAISEINAKQVDLLKMLAEFANGYSLSGPDGLKARSGLLEFRYDAV